MDVEKLINTVVARFIGTKHERDVKAIQPLVEQINALEPEMQKLSDAELMARRWLRWRGFVWGFGERSRECLDVPAAAWLHGD